MLTTKDAPVFALKMDKVTTERRTKILITRPVRVPVEWAQVTFSLCGNRAYICVQRSQV